MNTLLHFAQTPPQVPLATVWLLNELAEYRGKQAMFAQQSPERLKKLGEHAIIESAVSSNRIEGVEIEQKRIATVIFGRRLLHDRNELEVRGYQAALAWIHEQHACVPWTVDTVLQLHRLSRPESWDAGVFKQNDGEIIEKHGDGRVTLRFRPLAAAKTPEAITQLCQLTTQLQQQQQIPPLVIWAASNLDFLCIHPFRDGNGRVSRLLLLLHLYHLGFTAGRYVSLERLIEQHKERYYETLRIGSQGWHETAHDPWPYINFLLVILKDLYSQFEARYRQVEPAQGVKTAAVQRAITEFTGAFHITELQRHCPEAGVDLVRQVLKRLRQEGKVECLGRGKQARWRRIG